ncbi:MAG: site-specific DNA-methyltransferase [Muribaculaceae bacterium]|nr:site-specific DNA-methyltransferase [Muribaculaceae bacterium]
MKATDRHKLIDRINTLEGLTDDERSALLGLLREHKTYGLVWEDKPEDVEERMRNELPVLVEVKDRALTDAGPDAPNHILIEGDNLEALATLAYTHSGKIDVIYIDPPYNTGNKDFVYNDSYVDNEDSYRHSKWLSFMSKRLRIARKLLSDNGVMFISIDDNEQANLKLLCDDPDFGFGGNKFVGQLVWFKKRKGSFLSNKVVSLTEYILIYTRNPNIQLFGGLPSNNESQPIIKRTNTAKVLTFPPNIIKTKLPDGVYKKGVYGVGTSASELIEDVIAKGGTFITPVIIKAHFVWGQEFLEQELKNGTEVIVNTKNFQVRVIRHNNDSIKAMPSFIDGREEGATNEDAYELLKEVFATDRPFQYSKPVNLVKKLILANSYFNKAVTVLDFFAGSGTTLHAVMQLNAGDGGKRQCILCTNNENGICENVTYERNKRVIEGYTKPSGDYVEGLRNNNLRYYRTDFVGSSRSTKNMRRLVQLSTDMLCIKENLYTEKKSFAGLPTFKNIYRYFEHGEQKMLVIYDERYVDEIVKMINTVETTSKIKVYVFSPSEDPWEASFEPVNDKVELCALPQAIYNTYKRILPKCRQKPIEPTEEEDALAVSYEEEIGGLFAEEGGDE